MKNTGTVANDAVCVYYNSYIKPDLKVILAIIGMNIFCFTIYTLIIVSTIDDKLTGFSAISIYFLLPALYLISAGRITLWNLFGQENIIVNVRSLSYRRSFGFFTTQLKVIEVENVHFDVILREQTKKGCFGAVEFWRYNQLKLPLLFSRQV